MQTANAQAVCSARLRQRERSSGNLSQSAMMSGDIAPHSTMVHRKAYSVSRCRPGACGPTMTRSRTTTKDASASQAAKDAIQTDLDLSRGGMGGALWLTIAP